jgi:DNA-binding MarR family transcriptional regulator
VTVAEWIVLRQLYDGELMPSALAEKVGLKRAAISKLAERLVAKRMIEQRPSGGDRRAQTLALSTIGRAIVPTLATLAEESEEELFGFLDRDARESLKATLREIVRRHKVRAAAVDRGGGAPSDRAD